MKTSELSEQAVDTLLRAPLDVADDDFSGRLLHQLRAGQSQRVARGTGPLWPAWVLALAAAATGVPWEQLPGWLATLQLESRALITQLQVPAWPASAGAVPEATLWLPVTLALALLCMLLPLVEE
jgi:hypothetical protein